MASPSRTLRRAGGATALLLALAAPAVARADEDPTWYQDPSVNATWTQATIPSTDGVILHADILRPKGLTAADKTPVILSIGPYFNHSGQVGPAGPAEDSPYSPAGDTGPSQRFEDFVKGAHLMQKGYTYVMVDLRGFGGSTGCLDWAGPGEQADVKNAVEWAASRTWSSGKVGVYGKSYDAVTGLISIGQQPKGLAGVVAQEPVFDLYRYLYSNAQRFINSVETPALYDAIAATPGTVGPTGDTLTYQTDSANTTCYATNYADQATNDNHDSDYWKQRDLIAEDKGKSTPLFLTQGFLENNTKPDGSWDVFNGMTGPKRGWFGMWDHIRGNETAEGSDDTPLWYAQVMRFYDTYVAGTLSADTDPPVQVETQSGKWRSESQWPPADSAGFTTTLNTGMYSDDGMTDGSNEGAGANGLDAAGKEGVWTFSPPLTHDAQFAGVPEIKLDLAPTIGAMDTMGSTDLTDVNYAADVYDIDAKGVATLLSRDAGLIPTDGKVDLKMYGNDWYIASGHRIGVLVTDSNAEWYMPTSTRDMVTIKSGSITLPFLTKNRAAGDFYAIKVPTRLGTWLKAAPFTIPATTIAAGTSKSFALPPARTQEGGYVAPNVTATTITTTPTMTPTTDTTPAPTTAPGTTDAGLPGATATATTATTTTPAPAPAPNKAALPKLRVGLAVPHGHGTRRVHISGRAGARSRVTIVLRRNGRIVASRKLTTDAAGKYHVDVPIRRAGKYTAHVTVPAGTTSASQVTSRTSNVHGTFK